MNQQKEQLLKDFDKLFNIIQSHMMQQLEDELFESIKFKQALVKIYENDIIEYIIKEANE